MLSVVIPVFNRCDLTQNVLRDLWLTSNNDDEIVVIDNGSTDPTSRVLDSYQHYFEKRLKVLRNDNNQGYARGCNQGMRATTKDVIVLLNNDVVIRSAFQRQIVDALDENPKRVICGKLVDWKGGWNQFGDLVIPYAEGWCFAFRRQFIVDVGLFDEQFTPCYYEDVDLSYRAVKAGYELKQLALPIHHIRGQTGMQLPDHDAITHAHRALFAQKWGLKA